MYWEKHGVCEFVVTAPTRCPNCRAEIFGATFVEPQGGIEVDAGVGEGHGGDFPSNTLLFGCGVNVNLPGASDS